MSFRFAFDFARRPGQWRLETYSRQGRLLMAALLGGSLLCLTGLWKLYSEMTMATAVREALQYEMATASPTPLPSKPTTVSKAQAEAVNTAVRQLNLPWQDILETLEQATPDNVALLAIEPDSGRQLIRITAEAKTADRMLAYLARLNQSPFFAAASLTQHAVNEQDPQKPLRFTIEATFQDIATEGH